MKHKIQVVMLPTFNAENSIIKKGNQLKFESKLLTQSYLNSINCSSHHLYITVSQDIDPIKEGDSGYFISLDFDTPGVVKVDNVNKEDLEHIDYKIIATTDPKLLNYINPNYGEMPSKGIIIKDGLNYKPIPQLQQSFIKEYCSNPDGEWEIEYEIDMINELSSGNTPSETWVKLNQDNTVNITSVKEKMYSKSEMLNLMDDYQDYLFKTNQPVLQMRDWINKNIG